MKYSRTNLKWKLITVFTTLIVAFTLAVIVWMRLSFEEYVKQAEISRFRSSVIASMRIEAKDYYTSRDSEAFGLAISEIKRTNPGINTIFITDDGKLVAGDSDANIEKILGQLGSSSGNNAAIDSNFIMDAGRESQVIVSYKDELDPYTLHFGFSSSVIKLRTSNLSRKTSFVVGFIAFVAILLGAAFLHVLISPIEKAVKDAERLSLGDLKMKLQRGSRTEAGRIYGSLSRLKESILYSMKRLDMQ